MNFQIYCYLISIKICFSVNLIIWYCDICIIECCIFLFFSISSLKDLQIFNFFTSWEIVQVINLHCLLITFTFRKSSNTSSTSKTLYFPSICRFSNALNMLFSMKFSLIYFSSFKSFDENKQKCNNSHISVVKLFLSHSKHFLIWKHSTDNTVIWIVEYYEDVILL